MGVPPVIIHFNGVFPYKPSIWGYPHLWKPPYLYCHLQIGESQHQFADLHELLIARDVDEKPWI